MPGATADRIVSSLEFKLLGGVMKSLAVFTTAFLTAGVVVAFAQTDVAPGDKLRAAYLSTNPAQSSRNLQTGEIRGASFDLATELARRIGKPLDFIPIGSPPAVIEAVKSGEADIGFVAYAIAGSRSVWSSATMPCNSKASWCLATRRCMLLLMSIARVRKSAARETIR